MQLFIPCVRCNGEDEHCELCQGSGHEPLHRCPNALIEESGAEALLLHDIWPGCLPFAGGLGDQPALYVRAMRTLDRAKSVMEAFLRDLQTEKPSGG